VTLFKKGDRVFGQHIGAYAEYVCMPADGLLAILPPNSSYEDGASVPYGCFTALSFLRDIAHLQSGQKILINGASGGVGIFSIQIAKYFGAEVTAVCSGANADLVRSLGADHVFDYTREDFTKSGRIYDVVLDAMGTTSVSQCRRVLAPGGVHLYAICGLPQMIQMIWAKLIGGRRVVFAIASSSVEDLKFIGELLQAGRIKTIIDKRYPLEHTADAHRYAETGRTRGKVVILPVQAGSP
jgi:NADPH:quinone reductase-like Zn-dependent oxidoreductase